MSITQEKIELFKDAYQYHSQTQEMTGVEREWCEWAAERIKELEAEA